MLIVKPNDDEVAIGHLGRTQLINGFRSSADWLAVMRKRCASNSRRASPMVFLLSDFAGMDRRTYIHRHSMLPFMSFSLPSSSLTSDAYWGEHAICSRGCATPRAMAYLCPTCTKNDLHRLGYSYWRRAHQLPHAFWCDEHAGEALRAVSSESAFDQQPSFWLQAGKTDLHQIPLVNRDHPFLIRFGQACRAMLAESHPRDTALLRTVFGERARSLGFSAHRTKGSSRRRQQLSEFITGSVPATVLQHIYLTTACRGFTASCSELNEVIRSGTQAVTARGTALAMTLLYQSTSDALTALGPSGKLSPTAWNSPGTGIATLFIRNSGNLEKLAQIMQTDVPSIVRTLDSLKQKILSRMSSTAEGKALRAFEEGTPLIQSCQAHNADRPLVEKLLWLKVRKVTWRTKVSPPALSHLS